MSCRVWRRRSTEQFSGLGDSGFAALLKQHYSSLEAPRSFVPQGVPVLVSFATMSLVTFEHVQLIPGMDVNTE